MPNFRNNFLLLSASICIAVVSPCLCDNLEFYTDLNYRGNIPFFPGPEQGGWPEDPSNCFNFPNYAYKQLSSLRANGICIILYNNLRCSGRSIKIMSDVPDISALEGNQTHDNFNDEAMSIRLCDENEGSMDKVNVALYSQANYQSISQQHFDLCKCVTLPKTDSSSQPKSIDNHHNCIRLFSSETCNPDEGLFLDVFAGKSSISDDLTSTPIHGRIASFRPCQPPPACFKLAADVYRIVVVDDNEGNYISKNSDFLSMSAKTVIVNNGSAQIVQEYSARKEVKESTEVQTVTFDRRIESWGRLESKSSSWGIGIEIPNFSFGLNVANSLQKAYSETNEEAEKNGNRFVFESSTEFGVKQLIEVGPCSTYTVDSMVKVVDKYPMYYQMYFTLNGEHANKRMRADELKTVVQSMDDYTYNHTINEFSIGVYATSAIFASFGVETEIQGFGQRIPGCHA